MLKQLIFSQCQQRISSCCDTEQQNGSPWNSDFDIRQLQSSDKQNGRRPIPICNQLPKALVERVDQQLGSAKFGKGQGYFSLQLRS